MAMPAREALIDAKHGWNLTCARKIHAEPTSVKWMADQKEPLQLTQEHFPQEMYPIWATVYSREQNGPFGEEMKSKKPRRSLNDFFHLSFRTLLTIRTSCLDVFKDTEATFSYHFICPFAIEYISVTRTMPRHTMPLP